jgi:phosphate acetyltransferase
MVTDLATFEAAKTVASIQGRIMPTSYAKIQRAEELFDDFVDVGAIQRAVAAEREKRVNPRQFQYDLLARAKAAQQHIVLPEGEEPRILRVYIHIYISGYYVMVPSMLDCKY